MDYDLFVIGAGSGGVRAARIASDLGARVAIAEDLYLGGTCVNVGCVPKKLYVYASEFRNSFEDAQPFGWSKQSISFDWRTLRDNKCNEIKRLNTIYQKLLENTGAEIINGRAKLLDSNTIEVNSKAYEAEKILIATGGWPFVPDFPGSEYTITSNEIFDLADLPNRILVVGGGYIAVEFAGIFNGLGSKVTQIYRGSLFLRGFDKDVRNHTAGEITKSGVDLRFETNIIAVEKHNDEYHAQLDDGSILIVDSILCATGRKPNLQGLGLENVNVEIGLDEKLVIHEDFSTTEPSIFALGDVIPGPELTPIALAQGMHFARKQFGNLETKLEYGFIPTAVFSQPPIGTVGFTEDEAKKEFEKISLYKASFRPMKNTISGRDQETFIKLIVENKSDRVVGIHMVGPDAGEIIQGMAIALNAGATKSVFDKTIGIHPTTAEEFVTMRTVWSES